MKTKLKKWKRISSKIVYENNYYIVIKDKVLLPDGTKYNYYLTNRKIKAVVVLPVNAKGQLLISREYRHPVGQVIYQSVGGKVEKGETPLQAVKKELKEEAGFQASRWELLGNFYANPSRTGTIFYAYMASGLKKVKAEPESMEFIENDFFSQPQVENMIYEGKIKEPFFMAAYLLYKIKGRR
ncbi:NUDIX hydrolase [Patescibacteria group bacterium]|nr:NUDIX hydrolase [Patescibacteria group bacterium]MBU0963940.1 NUDIX hydrolase [Patescibacteria group bacterium]